METSSQERGLLIYKLSWIPAVAGMTLPFAYCHKWKGADVDIRAHKSCTKWYGSLPGAAIVRSTGLLTYEHLYIHNEQWQVSGNVLRIEEISQG